MTDHELQQDTNLALSDDEQRCGDLVLSKSHYLTQMGALWVQYRTFCLFQQLVKIGSIYEGLLHQLTED